jgi:hypothetical protein
VVRAIDVTTFLVHGDGAQFVVLAEPGTPPCGPSTSTFVVAGSARVHLRGAVRLPELVVDTCER